jgi:hypothetical protein
MAFIYAHFDVAILLAHRRLAERLCMAASDKPRVIRIKKFMFGIILHSTEPNEDFGSFRPVRCRVYLQFICFCRKRLLPITLRRCVSGHPRRLRTEGKHFGVEE